MTIIIETIQAFDVITMSCTIRIKDINLCQCFVYVFYYPAIIFLWFQCMTVLCLHCIIISFCAHETDEIIHTYIVTNSSTNSPVNFHLKLSNTNQLQVSVVSACIKTIFLTTYGDIMVVESLLLTTQAKKDEHWKWKMSWRKEFVSVWNKQKKK